MKKFLHPGMILLLLLAFVLVLAGCGGGGVKNDIPDSIAVVLGHGYDLTGRYAYSPEIKSAVLDLDKLVAAGQVKRDPNLLSGDFETISGTNATTYQQNLATKGSFSTSVGLFSAEIGANFSQSTVTSGNYSFATSTSKIVKDAYFIENKDNPGALSAYLTNGFKNDALTLAPQDLIARYGTHVMLGGVLGARLDYHMSAAQKSGSTNKDIGAYARAEARKTFLGIPIGGGGGASGSLEEDFSSSFETSTLATSTKVFGGKPELAQAVEDTGSYDAWINSIDGNEVWSDYYPGTVVPIYEFISDTLGTDGAARSQAVENYLLNDYFKNKQINYIGGDTCIMNLTVVYGDTSTVNVPQGYTQLKPDLNTTISGTAKWIYLCFQTGMASSIDPYPITDLTMIHGTGTYINDAVTPSGYTRLPVDLNMGAGGYYIFLCYKRDPAKANTPIRSIKIRPGNGSADTGYSFVTWNGTNTPADGNYGVTTSGVGPVYIEYTTNTN